MLLKDGEVLVAPHVCELGHVVSDWGGRAGAGPSGESNRCVGWMSEILCEIPLSIEAWIDSSSSSSSTCAACACRYDDLLYHTLLVVVACLINAIRNWKHRHSLSACGVALPQLRR